MSRIVRVAFALAAAAMLLVPASVSVAASDDLTMTARALLQGHARPGSWLAIEVRLTNDGPPVNGELRIQGGTQGGTRFSTPVELPTTSDKTYLLHAQPPAFGQEIDVTLVSDGKVVAEAPVAFRLHEVGQLIVGVVAENPQAVVGGLELPADGRGLAPAVVPLDVADLPERVEAWSGIDRLIWQDVDTAALTSGQLAALRGWIALGGRLIVAGGSTGPGVLSGLPDDLLPYRPTTTLDVDPEALTSLLGELPSSAAIVPAMAGELLRGRALARSGELVVAAQAPYGSGSVSIVGVDPTVGWIAETQAGDAIWRNLIPPKASGSAAVADDSQILGAVNELPSLALPPVGGLLILLLGYIVLIGPINYLVLKRLDRREWAWVTMPVLIAAFAVGAYAYGSALRGNEVIVNEVAIVRGAPDAEEGSAQVYLGVFSPSRGTYQLSVPSGALLSAPVSGDIFGGQSAPLDIVQGEPSRVRDLSVGFGSLRAVRAEGAAKVPRIQAELRLVDGTLQGTVRNLSDRTLEKPAVVLGGNVAMLPDMAPGTEQQVSLKLAAVGFGQTLGDRLFGPLFFGDPASSNDTTRRESARHRIVDQLTYDQNFGPTGELQADGPVLLAWGRDSLIDIQIEGQQADRLTNVLWHIPLSMSVTGKTTFRGDLMRNSVVESDAIIMGKDPRSMTMGRGSVTVAYRPVTFEGSIDASKVVLGVGFGGDAVGQPGPIKPAPGAPEPQCVTDPCPSAQPGPNFDGMPEVELFDLTDGGTWRRLPHMAAGELYDLEDPARYVDPGTGTLLVRFVAETDVNFAFSVTLEGTVK